MNKITTLGKALYILFFTGLLTVSEAYADSSVERVALCNAFEESNVDSKLIRKMEQAAVYGSLYRIVPNSSKVKFGVESFIGLVEAEFHDFAGGIALWHDQREDDGMSMVKVNSHSLESNNDFINDMLKSDALFNVEQFPDILFVSKDITWINDKTAVLNGDLTMHGVTRNIEFSVRLIVIEDDEFDNREKVLIEANAVVYRSDFGMNAYSSIVNNEVRLSMSVEAIRYRG